MIYTWFRSLKKRYVEDVDYTFDGDNIYDNLQWVSGTKPTLEEFQIMAQEDTATSFLELVRQYRNEKIAQTDWRFRSDLTPSQAWIDYCQALRDLPSDSNNWSWNENGDLTINWPTEPE
jgi:hypothetical protein